MKPEWDARLKHWIATLEKEFYEPMGGIPMEGYCTYDMLSPEEACRRDFLPMPVGMPWGHNWEYCWMRGGIELDERVSGKPIVMDIRCGGEATLFVNGQTFGTRRAEWVRQPHHYLCDQVLTVNGQPGERFELLLEAYAGHDYPESSVGNCCTGPIRPDSGDYEPRPDDAVRRVIGRSTWGVWHEEAYQLWLDVVTLRGLLSVIDDTSLRAAKIEEALEQFTLTVDFEQPRENRLADYVRAREILVHAMQAHNGSTAPVMSAVGNAHLDMCWLWPYRETQRKVARTFAQQLRLMELYPEYKFIQSQPQSYLECKRLYPDVYARIKEKIAAGQWIADGSMWVEPDTNMTSGESLIRQLIHGKRFYKDEFGVDCQLLWLPDTFGYSAVLPQILKGCGVKYLTTQKIFWTYNESDRFPYHYFTWQGMDGTEIVSFLHMDYTSNTDVATVYGRWRDRVQKRDLNTFLLPFGYGDGGGGPTRDHIEFVLREKDLEGVPKVKMQAPSECFEEMMAEGAPKNRYVGELYFQCHRGTYTSQAAIKKGNRKAELALREAELWSVAAAGKVAYPAAMLTRCWQSTLENQFHDILPGSSIARVYQDALVKHQRVMNETAEVISRATSALTSGEEGTTYFNSLSWERRALVRTGKGYGFATIPACGWTSAVDESLPAQPVTVHLEYGEAVMKNGLVTLQIDHCGRILSCTDKHGMSRISGTANELRMYKDVPRTFDAWDIDSLYDLQPVELGDEGSITIEEDNPFRCVLCVERRFSHSVWTQRIVMTADSGRIDFQTHIDWQERHRLLKVVFPTGIHAEEGINEIQFGYVKRPTHRSRPYDADRFEVCNHRYTALCDENRGAAVLNDCKYGVSMLGDEIALTLLRAATSPDLHADQGEHDFTYSYEFWDGPFAQSSVVQDGYELNVPVVCASGTSAPASLMQVDRDNVIIDTVKLAEDGSSDVIVRLYESKHTSCVAALKLNIPATQVYECDMMEQRIAELNCESGEVSLNMRGFEIKTLRVCAQK